MIQLSWEIWTETYDLNLESCFRRWASFVFSFIFSRMFHLRLATFKVCSCPLCSHGTVLGCRDLAEWCRHSECRLREVYHVLFSNKDAVLGKVSGFTAVTWLWWAGQMQASHPRSVCFVCSAYTSAGDRMPSLKSSNPKATNGLHRNPDLCLRSNRLMGFQKSSNWLLSYYIFWIKPEWLRWNRIL